MSTFKMLNITAGCLLVKQFAPPCLGRFGLGGKSLKGEKDLTLGKKYQNITLWLKIGHFFCGRPGRSAPPTQTHGIRI
jgi:hypothetical protein